jgi:hypothetical protein
MLSKQKLAVDIETQTLDITNTKGALSPLTGKIACIGVYNDTLKKVLIGEEKIDFDVLTIPFLMESIEGRNQISEYCLKDCELLWRLADKLGYVF